MIWYRIMIYIFIFLYWLEIWAVYDISEMFYFFHNLVKSDVFKKFILLRASFN